MVNKFKIVATQMSKIRGKAKFVDQSVGAPNIGIIFSKELIAV